MKSDSMSAEAVSPQPAPPAPAAGAAASAPAAPPGPVVPKPAPPPPPPPDPRIIALRDELQKVLGPGAAWELNGHLPAFRVPAAGWHTACHQLKEAGYDYCLFVTAADYPKESRFEMICVVARYAGGQEVAVVADVDRGRPVIETVSDLWLTAEWHEREVYDLFGVEFKNHGDLRRILLDESWQGHPLRKDYVDTAHEMIKRPY
jgi:NADH-quinone oxidoreductase subunit C